jgi:hypothetical protein
MPDDREDGVVGRRSPGEAAAPAAASRSGILAAVEPEGRA